MAVKLCAECVAFMVDLLEKRMRRILEVSRAEPDDIGLGEAECFHLMEIESILEGKLTCGVYDDYGPPPTITGPLFKEPRA